VPELRKYTVTQEREVEVRATSTYEAVEQARAAFENRVEDNDVTMVGTPVTPRETSLTVREDRY
jgi:hypothetical protein